MERAVAYVRVSTKNKAQLHSYEFQYEYWKESISNNTKYEFKGMYADYGISGKLLLKRPQLLQLMEDAKNNKFDVVFTKSVSRFSRNTMELLDMVRTLREYGIRVFFEKENIDTSNLSSELYLTIAASIAENDLNSYSKNVKWSYIKRFQKGIPWYSDRLLGYKVDFQNNTLEIIPEEAEVVKEIFDLYIKEYGYTQIAKILEKEQRTNTKGKVKWTMASIRYIINNERYTGDAMCQKTINNYSEKKINKGEQTKYYVEGAHESIISKDVFNRVQEIKESRRQRFNIKKERPPIYPFTHKVYCGVCGAKFNHKINHTNKPYRTDIWMCAQKSHLGSTVCRNTAIKDSVLKEKFIEAYNEFVETKPERSDEQTIKKELERLIRAENELKALNINGMLEQEDYNSEVEVIRKQIEILNKELSKYLMRDIKKKDMIKIKEFDESKVDKFIKQIIINQYTVEFIFINGISIKKEYTNGKAGNKKGWNK